MAYLGGRFLQTTVINSAAGGNLTVVAAVAGSKVKVYRLILVPSAAVTVTIFDGANALTGPMALAANTPFILDINHLLEPAFETSTGNAFIVNTGTAVQISGKADYLVVSQ